MSMYHQTNPTEMFRERQLALLKEVEDRRIARRLNTGQLPKKRSRTATTLSILAVLVVVATLLMISAAGPAHADGETIIKVNSTSDKGDAGLNGICNTGPIVLGTQPECTLRAAIQESNFTPEKEIIAFDIPSTDSNCDASTHVCTIFPGAILPPITQPAVINGYSQPGSSFNTLAVGDNAVLKIELDGSRAAGGTSIRGLEILNSSDSLILGLVINGFSGTGIAISGDTSSGPTIAFNNRIAGNFIGTDPSGTQDLGNGSSGVTIGAGAFTTVVGGTSTIERNLISGNGVRGVNILSGSAGTKVEGNYIGTDRSGKADLGNTGSGVVAEGANNNTVGGATAGAGNLVSGNGANGVGLLGSNNKVLGNRIGTTASGTGSLGNDQVGLALVSAVDTLVGDGTSAGANTIAFNSADGVEITGGLSTGNAISRNSVFSNGRLGIDLFGGVQDAAGKTANDPGDVDAGPNGLQNKPAITSARMSATGKTLIRGKLNSALARAFKVQFYASPSGNEGKRFIGEKAVTTDSSSGNVSFKFAAKGVALGQKITATATGLDGTSEFSAPKKVVRR
jgi:hypothetical protein